MSERTARAALGFRAIASVSFLCVFAGLVVGGPAGTAAADNPNVAKVIPSAVIPLMAKAPEIDGVIGEGEWNTLHVCRFVSQRYGGKDVSQPRFGEFWIGCDGRKLYFAVRSAVHPTMGPVAELEPVKGNKDVGKTVFDDSIELWIDNKPTGKDGKYYQLMVNSRGAQFDKMFDRKDGSANMWWRPESFRQAHKVAGGTWTAEFAIDLKDIEIADPGNTVAVRVCRNYKFDWDQSRWAPGVISFDSPETMGKVRFIPDAPVVNEIGFQDADGIHIAVELTNPTAKPLPVKVKLGQNPENQPRYFKDWSVTLTPGERKLFEYKSKFFSVENYPAIGEILVTDPAGRPYYHRDFKWHTKPANIWAAAGSKKPEEVTKFDIEWHPTPKILRWRTAFDKFEDKSKVRQVRVAVFDAKSGAKVAEDAAKDLKGFRTERRAVLTDLPDGEFEARLFLDGAGDKPVKTAVFHHASDFPWLNNKIGISDEVIPPFTPLTVQGSTVGAVLRDHEMTDTGLWKQVRALGRDILAGPIRVETRQGGRTMAAKGTLKFTESKPNRVVAESKWTAGSVAGTTVSEFDYDGCMKVTLTFGPGAEGEQPQTELLELVIPVTDAAAPLMHACGDGLRFNYAGAVPEGDGEVWTSKRASRIDMVGTFLPYLWIGGQQRGICWFAGSDRDWVVDLKDEVAAMALERKDGVLTLRVRLVQTPASLDREHKVVFGLMATPAKPMPTQPHWRTWSLGTPGKFRTQILGMCMYWGGQLYGVFPAERDFTVVRKIAESAKEGKHDAEFFADYVQKHPGIKAEIRYSANQRNLNAVIPYTNLRGALTYPKEWVVYQNEWRKDNFPPRQTDLGRQAGGIDFQITPTASRRDFLLYYYREFLRNGFDGIYWDNICIYSNQNLV
ncbi:MAG TPA: glycoside hydrolase domain-containing protein, partial [Phycisphaerae bacterium]|nr:glycoside hydrolase domain-containing protein [Phycisphaerae bacterium]